MGRGAPVSVDAGEQMWGRRSSAGRLSMMKRRGDKRRPYRSAEFGRMISVVAARRRGGRYHKVNISRRRR